MDYYSSLNSSALDPETPTLFELLSSKELDDLIAPSLRFILTFYAQRHPRYLLRIATKYDELYALIKGLVEFYHLKNWNGSFTEKFYGLKRTSVLNYNPRRAKLVVPEIIEANQRLNRKQIAGSLFFIIAVPYIKEKLDVKYERLRAKYLVRDVDAERKRVQETGSSLDKFWFEFEYNFYRIYPVVNMANSVTTLAFYLLFLFSKTSAHSPVDFILGMKYSRLSNYDYVLDSQRAAKTSRLSSNSSDEDLPLIGKVVEFFTSRHGLSRAKDTILSGLSYALPTSMFLLKFLEWWSASDFARQLSTKSRQILDDNLTVPKGFDEVKETDKVDEKLSGDSAEKLSGDSSEKSIEHPSSKSQEQEATKTRDTSLCSLCGDEITNPTALETGVVYCYTCIYKYLESGDEVSGGRCPVTGQKLLGCRYSEEKEEWEVGGLRRIMV